MHLTQCSISECSVDGDQLQKNMPNIPVEHCVENGVYHSYLQIKWVKIWRQIRFVGDGIMDWMLS